MVARTHARTHARARTHANAGKKGEIQKVPRQKCDGDAMLELGTCEGPRARAQSLP